MIALLLVLAMVLALTACSTPAGETSASASEPSESASESVSESVSESASESSESTDTREWWQMVDVDWTENSVALDTGINMTYMTIGPEDGDIIVLIHGATDSRLSWAQVAPQLADAGYRVYVPELRGHGKTDKPAGVNGIYTVEEHAADIISFMDKVGIKSADVVGHSLGSLIAQELAADIPDKVKSITLIASGAKSCDNESLTWVYEGDGTDYLGVHGYDDTKTFPPEFLADWAGCTNEDADFCKGIYMHAAQLPYEVWGYIFGGLQVYDNTDGLADITCPVQIIWGTKDSIFLESDQKALQDGLVNAASVDFVPIEGASHNTHWDSKANATKVSGLIADFAASHK